MKLCFDFCYGYVAASCFVKQFFSGCCSKLLCQAAFSWLLQQWLGARQQLLYIGQLSFVSTLYAFSLSQLTPIWLVFMLILILLKAFIVISDVKDILRSLQCMFIALQVSFISRSHVSSFLLAFVHNGRKSR